MTTTRSTTRPLSPHLFDTRWGPHMMVSIIHRISGDGLAIVGGLSLIWWLVAAATSKAYYDYFLSWATSIWGVIIGVGLTWAFFQHMFSGIRHLVMDTGAGYELKTNKMWSIMVFVFAGFATAFVWMYILKGQI